MSSFIFNGTADESPLGKKKRESSEELSRGPSVEIRTQGLLNPIDVRLTLSYVIRLYPALRKNLYFQGLTVVRNYKSCGGAENGVTVKVTPFFCVQG